MEDPEFKFVVDVKGNVVKKEKDLSAETDAKISACNKLIQNGQFTEALDILWVIEKKARSAADLSSYITIITYMLEIHFNAKLWDQLNQLILSLTRRHGQLKQAIVSMVQKCCTFLDSVPTEDVKIQLIKTLCNVSTNKIYVENERARLLKTLADIREKEGNIDEAGELIKDLQVESYTTMPMEEKNAIMTEQIRLCIAKNDIIRAQIISRKINSTTICDKEQPELKLKYYRIMMKLRFMEENYIDVSHYALSSLNLSIVLSDTDTFYPLFRMAILCLLIAPFDEKKRDLHKRIIQHRNINEMTFYKSLLDLFDKDELIDWEPLNSRWGSDLLQDLLPDKFSFTSSPADANKLFKLFQTRVIQHNISIIYQCYSHIRLERMAQLLSLTEDETEMAISQAVYSKVVFARIDRPKRTVMFRPKLNSAEVLNSYSDRILKLLLDVGHAATLINKEYNQHSVCEAT